MVVVTASEFKTLINDADISNSTAEKLINQAVNKLNLYGADLPNMTGTEGSKTLSCESKEAGAIYEVARLFYYGYYKGLETVSIGGLSVSPKDPIVEAEIQRMARNLIEPEVSYG